MKSMYSCAVAVFAVLVTGSYLVAAQIGATIFEEDFNDGSAIVRWENPVIDAENGTFDGSVNFAFDYGAVGIPNAPGGAGSTGLFFEVNITDQGGDQGEAASVSPLGFILPDTNYLYSVDAYFVVESQNSGSTEFGLIGAHAVAPNAPADQGINDDVPFDFGISNGNGVSWMASGDSGAFNDFHRFEDANNANTGSQIGLGGYDTRDPIPGIADQVNEGPRGQWITLSILSVNDVMSFRINGFEIDSILNGADYTGGNIMLGYADYFNSVATKDFLVGPDPTPFDPSDGPYGDDIPGFGHFVVFDNVMVQEVVPEPTTAALLGLAGVALLRRRRA